VRSYEVLFIVRPDYEEEQISSIIARYTDVITSQKAVVTTAEKWAKRRLAYELDDFREGIYIIITFEGPSDLAIELDRRMKLDQQILRHMVSRVSNVAKKELEEKKRKARRQEARIDSGTKGQAKPEATVVKEQASQEATVQE